uniref:Uncharacterized protein n=1 Tax=Brassica oleracea TaxID=3712 RepID=A0A3P6FNB0_BRAOL|nr:unnamed protein product [Brassica oleracea]
MRGCSLSANGPPLEKNEEDMHGTPTYNQKTRIFYSPEETRYLIADVYKRAECGKLINLREVLGAFSMNNVTRMLLAREAILWARVCSRSKRSSRVYAYNS